MQDRARFHGVTNVVTNVVTTFVLPTHPRLSMTVGRAVPNIFMLGGGGGGGGGGKLHSAPPKVVRRAAKWRSVHAKRRNFFLRVLFSNQEALS